MFRWSAFASVAVLGLMAACVTDPVSPPGPLTLVNAFSNLSFSRPVFLTHSNDGTDRLFVVEQAGIMRVFQNDSTATSAGVFLNITGRVNDGSNEMGLLGLAFHPNFASNGFFYVNYTTGSGSQRRTVISRFSVTSGQPDQGDPNSEFILLEIGQPFSNHNGGMLQFGPDGFLYIAVGDGGSGGDPNNDGQNRATLLGTILRIDVD
ncbi:PQQ-dependent sugar dehydrogenase, partial [bacterium]|nr:PQQ-dependent sugar dehydrogenase [bacterium]